MIRFLVLASLISRTASIVLLALTLIFFGNVALAHDELYTGDCGGCVTACPAACTSLGCTGPAGSVCDLSCNCTLRADETCPCGG